MRKPQFNPSPDTAPRPREPHPDGFGKKFIFQGKREHFTTEALARLLLRKDYIRIEHIRTMRLTRLAREKAEKDSVAPAPDAAVDAPAPDIAEVQQAEPEHRASVPASVPVVPAGQPPASPRIHGAGLDAGRALLEALSTTDVVENLSKEAEATPAVPATGQPASCTGSPASGQSKKSVSFASAKLDTTRAPEPPKSDGKANSRVNSSPSTPDAAKPGDSSKPPSLKGILRSLTPPPVPPESPLNPPPLNETQVRRVFIPQSNFPLVPYSPSVSPYTSHNQSNHLTPHHHHKATRIPPPPIIFTIGGRSQTYAFDKPHATSPLSHFNAHSPSHAHAHTHTQQYNHNHNHHNHAPNNYHHQPSHPYPSDDSNTTLCTGCSCLYLPPNSLDDHESHMICCKCHKSIEQHML